MLKRRIINLCIIFSVFSSFCEENSLVGSDNRQNLYEIADQNQKKRVLTLAKSICLITTIDQVSTENGKIRMKVDGTLKEVWSKNVFNNEGTIFSNNIKFLNQPVNKFGATGFLVADNLIATAYHVPKELMMIPPCQCEFPSWTGECFDKSTCAPEVTTYFNYGVVS